MSERLFALLRRAFLQEDNYAFTAARPVSNSSVTAPASRLGSRALWRALALRLWALLQLRAPAACAFACWMIY